MNIIKGLVVIGILIAVICVGCSSAVPTKPIQQQPVQKSYNVEFIVTGTAPKAVIGFRCDNSGKDFVSEVQDIPWERKLSCRPGPGQNFTLSVTHRVDSPGSITCEIKVDGITGDSETLSAMKDGLSMVSCSVFP